jgi:hypothetical protein
MRCEPCGHPLVRVLGEETITTLEGRTILFRRLTDYLLCRNCLRLYSVVRLRARQEGDQAEYSGEVVDMTGLSRDGWSRSDDLSEDPVSLMGAGGLVIADFGESQKALVQETSGDEPVPLADEFEQ